MILSKFNKLDLHNFRGFKKSQGIQFAPLTFFVGPNSSGKSSIFDALLFLSQSRLYPCSNSLFTPQWIGKLVDLGSFNDTVYKHADALSIRICVNLSIIRGEPFNEKNEVYDDFKIEFKISSSKKDPIGRLSTICVIDTLSNSKLELKFHKLKPIVIANYENISQEIALRDIISGPFPRAYSKIADEIKKQLKKKKLGRRKSGWSRLLNNLDSFQYLYFIDGVERVSSGRSAPKRWYPLSKEAPIQNWYDIRNRGLYEGVEPSLVETEILSENRGFFVFERPRKTNDLMRQSLKKLEIAKNIIIKKVSDYHTSIRLKDSITSIESNIIDTGYGASQIIPVIAACQSQCVGPLFVEQPEIHLHPKAQGTVAELLCNTSKHRQVVVETHSVHMINKARIMIAEGKLSPDDVVINYVKNTADGSIVNSIPLDKKGHFLTEWPEGFFDERYEDTLKLIKMQSE